MKFVKVLPRVLLGLIYIVLIILLCILLASYLPYAFEAFDIFSLAKFDSDNKFGIILWGFTEVLIVLGIECVCFLELLLWIIRLIVRNTVKIGNALTGKNISSTFINKVSILTVFKKIGINDMKKGVIFFFIYIAVIYGSNYLIQNKRIGVGKSLVYRAYNQTTPQYIKSLNVKRIEDINIEDLINSDETINIVVKSGNANLYIDRRAIASANNLYLEYNYDVEAQLNIFTYNYDDATNTLSIEVNNYEEEYTKYTDPLLQTIVILVPKNVSVKTISFETNEGYFLLGDMQVDQLDITSKKGNVTLKLAKQDIGTANINVQNVLFNGTFPVVKSLNIEAVNSEISITKSIAETMVITLTDSVINLNGFTDGDKLLLTANDSEVYLFNIYQKLFQIDANNSKVEIQNVLDSNFVYDDDSYVHGIESSIKTNKDFPVETQGDE